MLIISLLVREQELLADITGYSTENVEFWQEEQRIGIKMTAFMHVLKIVFKEVNARTDLKVD